MSTDKLLHEIAYLLGALAQNLPAESRFEALGLREQLFASPLSDLALQEAATLALDVVVQSLVSRRDTRIMEAGTVLWALYDAIYRNEADRVLTNFYVRSLKASLGPPTSPIHD